MGLALLWVAPVSFAIVLLSRKLQVKLGKKHMNAKLTLAEGIQECLETVQDIEACNLEEQYLKKLDAKIDAAEASQISSETATASLVTAGQMFLRLGLATVIVVGNMLILRSETTLFAYILFLIAASRLYDPLSGAMTNMAELFSVDLQVDRLKAIQNYPEETGEKDYHTNGYDITFDHMRFSYEPGKPVLKHVSMHVRPGERIGLVGATGAGKTTILNMLPRFYDIASGEITIDGVRIECIARDDLRRLLAIVLQDTHLFTGTVADNIRFGNLDATDDDIVRAAKLTSAHSFIKRLPHGYDTMLENDGENLSQGQRQLLNIARAAVANPSVLLLDEATSNIDTRSEMLIQRGLDKLMEGRTSFVIAHRLSTVRTLDRILVLENGEIIEEGNHAELMARKGYYYRLYCNQFE